MRRVCAYVDTSVFGGVADVEFSAASRRFFERVRRGQIDVLISELSIRELSQAPENVRQVLDTLPEGSVREVQVSEEATALAKAYLDARILGGAQLPDAIHVATATVAAADVIVSWNFRHYGDED